MIASASRHTTKLPPCIFTENSSSLSCERLTNEAPPTCEKDTQLWGYEGGLPLFTNDRYWGAWVQDG
jgi:hypothetical protein